MHDPVSVVIPAFNAASTIDAAVSTLRGQSWSNLEIIVVDDGSTDGTAAILDRMAVEGDLRVIHQENAGVATARDAGVAAAQGEFILLADADDTSDRDLVATLAAGIGDHDLAFARCRYIDALDTVLAVQDIQPRHPDAHALLRGIMVNSPLVRRSAILAVGGHDATLGASVDLDLFVRLSMRRPGALVALPEVLSGYRRDAQDAGGRQLTSDWRRMQRTWTRVRDKAVQAGLRITRAEANAMRGQHCIYWATLAYMAGDHRAARRLMAEATWRMPGHVLRDDLARVRLAACLASLLPRPLHDRIRTRFNARRGMK